MKRKHPLWIPALTLAASLLLGSLAGCGPSAASPSPTNTLPGVQVSTDDDDSSWDPATATGIALSGTSITVDGPGATADEGVVTITQSGVYAVSGTLTDGQIVVAAHKGDTVRLVLNGAEIKSSAGAPIYASQCDKLIVTLAEGTQNTLSDGSGAQEEADAALFCMDKLTINGSGALAIETAFRNGISAKGAMVIAAGVLDIVCARDAIQADAIPNGYKGIEAGGDLSISGGLLFIDSYDDCIHSTGSITLSGGALTLSTAGDGIHADGDLAVSGGSIGILSSHVGLKAASVSISDGVVEITASDDGINAAGGRDPSGSEPSDPDRFAGTGDRGIHISGGHVTLSAGGDGLDAKGVLAISGGRVVSIIHSTSDHRALGCDGAPRITGGTLIYGGTAAGTVFSSDSTQSFVFVSAGLAAGGELTVRQGGDPLIRYTLDADLSVLALSAPGIISGERYEIYVGETLLCTVTAGDGAGETDDGDSADEQRPPDDSYRPNDSQRPNGPPQMPDGARPPDGGQLPGDWPLPDGEQRPVGAVWPR